MCSVLLNSSVNRLLKEYGVRFRWKSKRCAEEKWYDGELQDPIGAPKGPKGFLGNPRASRGPKGPLKAPCRPNLAPQRPPAR